MKIKVLPLAKWMTHKATVDATLENYKPCTQIFGRPGRYKVGKYSWFELSDGRAYWERKGAFVQTMRMHTRIATTDEQVNILKRLAKLMPLSKQQQEILDVTYLSRWSFLTRLQARKCRLNMQRNVNKLRLERTLMPELVQDDKGKRLCPVESAREFSE